jgi:TnpA family transposase
MPAYHRRFIGATVLPKTLSEADVELCFALSAADIAALRQRFNFKHRLAAALQLTVLRATGRTPDKVVGVPKALLAGLARALDLTAPSIATLRSLYTRRPTLFEHQAWARSACGLTEPGEAVLRELEQALKTLSASAADIDELVVDAGHWLFDRQCLLPSDRILRDLARAAFADVQASAIEAIKRDVSAAELRSALVAVRTKRRGRSGGTVFEWLKGGPGKPGQMTITELTEKIAYLRTLHVDTWNLDAISGNRMRAYARAIEARPPAQTAKLVDDTLLLELACFLRLKLLDLTDDLIYAAGRRFNDLKRQATSQVVGTQAKSAAALLQRQEDIRTLAHAPDMTADQKIETLKRLLPLDEKKPPGTRAALVREALVDDGVRVSALVTSLTDLDVCGDPHSRPIRQIKALRELQASGSTELPADFDLGMLDSTWRDLAAGDDRFRALAALRASVVASVRQGLIGGHLWVDHSWAYRNRDELLIPVEEWRRRRAELVGALGLVLNPDVFLRRLQANLQVGLQALAEAVEAGHVQIDAQGLVRLPALQAADIDTSVARTRRALFDVIGPVQFCDVLVELDAHAGYSELLLGRRARSEAELVACYGGLLAHGTENDAKGVAAMVPGLEATHVNSAMRALEAQGRLRRANQRVAQFQSSHPIAELWGSGTKASSDMMALEATRHLYNARVDPRLRKRAIGIYTHVRDQYGIFYDQPVVLNERQAAAAVHGVEDHNAQGEEAMRLSLLAVDTHGYTNVAMAVAKLLGFDLCPRLKDLAERRLYLPRGVEVPQSLERVACGRVKLLAVHEGWDELLRLIASIRLGRVSAKEALDRLGSAARGQALHAAAEHLGRMLRTLFLCDYLSNVAFRREIHALLNRGEAVHLLQRAVYSGRVSAARGRRHDEMRTISGSHALLTNIVIAWNTMKMQAVVDRWRRDKHPIDDEWIRHMGPIHFENINFRGRMSFAVGRYADTLLERKPTARVPAASRG